jgi:hypothetical protein
VDFGTKDYGEENMGDDWEQVKSRNLGPLKALTALTLRLQGLVDLEPEALSQDERRELQALGGRARRQREKLEKGEFHIAVVGC